MLICNELKNLSSIKHFNKIKIDKYCAIINIKSCNLRLTINKTFSNELKINKY